MARHPVSGFSLVRALGHSCADRQHPMAFITLFMVKGTGSCSEIKDMHSSVNSAGRIRQIVRIIPGDPPMTP
jgi:hypothetical protein